MSINWKSAPLIRLILPLIGGILVGIYTDLQSTLWIFPLLLSGIILGLLLVISKLRPSLKKEYFFGLLVQIVFLFAGLNLIVFKTAKNKPDHYQHYITENFNSFIIEVAEIPKEKPNSIQIIAKIKAVKEGNDKWVSTSGNVLLYFQKDTASENILQGDEIIISSTLQNIQPPQNPGQFNYKQYLSFNQIYQQGFVGLTDWKLLSTGHLSLISFASGIRDRLLQALKTHGLSDDELAVASALILGYKDDLDNELKHAYSSAGATHVLAVSGLHVGIIFIAVSFILGIFDKREKLIFIRLFILLFILWTYATITGLSPSVVRAATMFSFVAVGKAFKRDSNIYNTLAGSALVLLIINPYLIMEVGFQLSYLAVLGIVYFQKMIYRTISINHKIGDYIWTITSVSIAAQLTTFPLGLLYFHQFPTYFFISNLVVIPAAMIIIALGLGLFITIWIPPVAAIFGWVLTGVIFVMNWVVKSIDKLPVSLIEGISISVLECWLIYATLVFLMLARETRKLRYLNLAMVFCIAMLIIDHMEDFQNKMNREISFYSVKGEPNINFIAGSENALICNDQLFEDRSAMLFNIKHHWFDLDLNSPKHYTLSDSIVDTHLLGAKGFYQFYDQTVFHLSSNVPAFNVGKVDLLYISSEKFIPFDLILTKINPSFIILSNGCHWKYRKEFDQIDYPNIGYHDIKRQGAYIKYF